MAIILILGATGKVGKELVKEIRGPKTQIRLGVRKEPLDNTHDTVQFDFDKLNTYDQAFDGVDYLFLLTPFTNNQVEMVRKTVAAAKKHNVKHIVRLSALGADTAAITLGKWHREAEQIIEESGIPYTHLRPNAFMQNFIDNFAHTIKNYNQFYLPLGDAKVSYIDTRDIGRVAKEILLHPEPHQNKAYNLTGPQALSGSDIENIFTKALGRKIEYVNVSEEKARHGLAQASLPQWAVDAIIELFTIQAKGYAAEVNDNVQIVGKEKPHTFEEFVHHNVHLFR